MRISKARDDYAKQLTRFEQQPTHSLENCLDLVLKALEKEDYETAIFYLGKAIELDPSDISAIRVRAKIYLVKKQFDDAEADTNYLLNLDPKDQEALEFKEKILKRLDDHRKFRAFPIYS